MELYAIRTNEIYGRFLVASRDLKPGEVILEENPTVVGAPIDATHVCFKCSRTLRTNLKVCKKCGLATLCSTDCLGTGHSDGECQALERTGLKTIDIINDPQIVMPLRCLMIRRYDEQLWKELTRLESHVEKRRGTSIWKTHEVTVENVMKRLHLINEADTSDAVIQKICGILDVNTFELRPPNCKVTMGNNKDCLRGLYLKASLMAHDCVGNTHLSIDDDLTMTVHASRPIARGETIFFNYSSCLKNTGDRRLHLRTGKYFDCNCSRCSDPTELGTHMSSVKCAKCKTGPVVPTDPLDNEYKTPWSCQSCGAQHMGQMVRTLLYVAQEKILDLDTTSLEDHENLLRTLSTSLGENHQFILELKQNLVPIYESKIFNDRSLKRTIDVCEELLKVLKVVEPGISRLQGIASYQLHSIKVNLSNKQYQEKTVSTECYLEILQDAEKDLVESMKHLVYEPKNSPEGRLLQNAFNDLKILRNIIKQTQIKRSVAKLPEKDDLFAKIKSKR